MFFLLLPLLFMTSNFVEAAPKTTARNENREGDNHTAKKQRQLAEDKQDMIEISKHDITLSIIFKYHKEISSYFEKVDKSAIKQGYKDIYEAAFMNTFNEFVNRYQEKHPEEKFKIVPFFIVFKNIAREQIYANELFGSLAETIPAEQCHEKNPKKFYF